MKKRLLACAASAALTVLAVPAIGATSPQLPPPAPSSAEPVDQAVAAFYAARQGSPLWLRGGSNDPAARALIDVLRRAALDGLPSGPALAAQAQALIGAASAGDKQALGSADRLLSAAWVMYVEALQTPPPGMIYADPWVRPHQDTPQLILARAAAAASLSEQVRKVAAVNPVYAQLRDAAWTAMQANGGQIDQRVITSLDRARDMPFQSRYLMVDAAAARLYMIDNGRIADSMKVIVGKSSTQTPMLASTIYYATLNPYWHVSDDMIRSLIARNVLDQGLSYLKVHGYQVLPADEGDDRLLDPAKVDWRAVAAGTQAVRVRQLPGPGNSMGHIKFGFPNADDVYLHDTPSKDLFAQDDRGLSHGCIRLEDATRLGRWLLGREPQVTSNAPEQNVLLPAPVPIYITYLTAQASDDGQLSFVDDVYGKDSRQASVVASVR